MRPTFVYCSFAFVCITAGAPGCSKSNEVPPPAQATGESQNKDGISPGLEKSARAFIALLVDDDFDKATKSFDDTMKKEMPASKIRKIWTELIAQLGPFKNQGKIRQEKKDEYEIVFVLCTFARGSIDVQITFDADKKIAGLYFNRAKTPTGS
jgi:hypothetical protein